MGGFGENAERAGSEADYDFQGGDDESRQDGVAGNVTLFAAHRSGGKNGRPWRHRGHYRFGWSLRQPLWGETQSLPVKRSGENVG